MTSGPMTSGQAAGAAGLSRKALRIYEEKGLVPEAERTPAGYRLYTDRDVERLTFIRRARTLGLHLDDIGRVLAIRDGGIPPCDTVRDLLDARVCEIDDTVRELLALRATLASTREFADERTAQADSDTVCHIIEGA